MSDNNPLIEALVRARAEFPPIPKDSTNPHFKNRFASLDSVLGAIVPVLAKHGLVVVQPVRGQAVETTIWHTCGEAITSSYPLPEQSDPQKLGAAVTYARRYSLCALLGITADEDDDGNAASGASKARKDRQRAQEGPSEAAGEAIPRHRTEDPPPTQQGPSKAAAVAYVAKTLNEAFPPEPGEDVELPEGQQRVIEALFPGHRTWERVQNATIQDLTNICRNKGARLLGVIESVKTGLLADTMKQDDEASELAMHGEEIRQSIKNTLAALRKDDPARARIVSDTILKALTDAGCSALSEAPLKVLTGIADTIDRLEDAT